VPEDRLKRLQREDPFHYVRYEVSIGIEKETGEYQILDEQVILQRKVSKPQEAEAERTLFHHPHSPRQPSCKLEMWATEGNARCARCTMATTTSIRD
jgi:hypothetical protein